MLDGSKGRSITVLLPFCLTGSESAVRMTTYHLQNRLIQTSQRGGQWYSDTCSNYPGCLLFSSQKQT